MSDSRNPQPFYRKKAGRVTWYNCYNIRISKAKAMKMLQLLKQRGVKLVANAVAAKRALKKVSQRKRPIKKIVKHKKSSQQKRKDTKKKPIKVSGSMSLTEFNKILSQKSQDTLCLGGGSKLHIPKRFSSVLSKKVNVGKGPIYFVFYDSAEYTMGNMPRSPHGNDTVKLVKSVGLNGNRHIVYKLKKQNPTFKQLVGALHLILNNFFECLFDVKVTATTSGMKKVIKTQFGSQKGKFLAVKGNR